MVEYLIFYYFQSVNINVNRDNADFCLIGFYVKPTQYRSYGDVPVLLVEEDLMCPFVHYVRHEPVLE
jgi:hypothetical protein